MAESIQDEAFIRRKHEQTLKLRAEFLKQSSNPFRHATGEGGTVVSIATILIMSSKQAQWAPY